jgi:hypothetical protein
VSGGISAASSLHFKEITTMLVKIYWVTWGVFALAGLLLFAAGSFTMITAITFGFIAFGMVFMGMMGVLPAMISHPAPPVEAKVAAPQMQPARERKTVTVGIWKSA